MPWRNRVCFYSTPLWPKTCKIKCYYQRQFAWDLERCSSSQSIISFQATMFSSHTSWQPSEYDFSHVFFFVLSLENQQTPLSRLMSNWAATAPACIWKGVWKNWACLFYYFCIFLLCWLWDLQHLFSAWVQNL